MIGLDTYAKVVIEILENVQIRFSERHGDIIVHNLSRSNDCAKIGSLI